MRWLGLLAAVAPVYIGVALAQALPTRPDADLTPGVISSTDPAEVRDVVGGEHRSRRHRVSFQWSARTSPTNATMTTAPPITFQNTDAAPQGVKREYIGHSCKMRF